MRCGDDTIVEYAGAGKANHSSDGPRQSRPAVLSVRMNPTSLALIVLATALAVAPGLAQPLHPEVQLTDRERIKADRAKMDEAMKRETTKRPWDGILLLRPHAAEAAVAAPAVSPK